MFSTEKKSEFIHALEQSILQGNFVKISLGNYQGAVQALKQVLIKPILIKQQLFYSFTFRYQTKDLIKNFAEDQWIYELELLLSSGFKIATLFSTAQDFILEVLNNGKTVLRALAAVNTQQASLAHNSLKQHKLAVNNKSYLQALNLCNAQGEVYKNAQDKYRQIQHYIELLSPLFKEVNWEEFGEVADMGAGKGYLTFALYDYLNHTLKAQVPVIGVEFRPDLVAQGNVLAQQSGFENLKFVEGSIQDYHNPNIDLLIALHACDTATDDAIYKGVMAQSKLIVVAPCCHKQIRRAIEQQGIPETLKPMLKHGIFLERQAEMLTDAMRSLILEYQGYKTKAMQFISDAHTPKNVMITAQRRPQEYLQSEAHKQQQIQIAAQLKSLKQVFGISKHHLENLLDLNF